MLALNIGEQIAEVRIQELSHDSITTLFVMKSGNSHCFKAQQRDKIKFEEVRKMLASLKGATVKSISVGENKVTWWFNNGGLFSINGIQKSEINRYIGSIGKGLSGQIN